MTLIIHTTKRQVIAIARGMGLYPIFGDVRGSVRYIVPWLDVMYQYSKD